MTFDNPTSQHHSYSLTGDNQPLDRADWIGIAGAVGSALAGLACFGLASAYLWQWAVA